LQDADNAKIIFEPILSDVFWQEYLRTLFHKRLQGISDYSMEL